ncbi:MAG: hypothetical protein A2Y98_01845 [Candidatus Portnoybacteria bacterium RBG_19FT_COMBO_36_7]|uniref:Uncharacterized protein n=1 Tax=Candidatus Portnoybacteria bacterium RBG_19FT_COMBO_36_7 TaxID=1801992 RepID=A0A1G2F6F2_9BACT|nr:MAG: hypothetical protein A2Y98_01845 [Candidatus Portnoybacteria bacterium RBG_19FT_COMBO_36_7]
MRRKIFWVLLIFVTIVFDWLALDDIITGSEPNYFDEYAILAASAVFFGVLAYAYLRKKKKEQPLKHKND